MVLGNGRGVSPPIAPAKWNTFCPSRSPLGGKSEIDALICEELIVEMVFDFGHVGGDVDVL